MTTHINRFGEEVTKWQSHKHPDDPYFQQRVNWTVWVKPDGRVTVGFNLGANGKTYFVYGITKEQAVERFSDDNYETSTKKQQYINSLEHDRNHALIDLATSLQFFWRHGELKSRHYLENEVKWIKHELEMIEADRTYKPWKDWENY